MLIGTIGAVGLRLTVVVIQLMEAMRGARFERVSIAILDGSGPTGSGGEAGAELDDGGVVDGISRFEWDGRAEGARAESVGRGAIGEFT